MDPEVQNYLKELKGFLVDYPQDLLSNEKLAPNLLGNFVSNDLWT